MSQDLTREEIEKALPPNLKTAATQALTDLVNTIAGDPLVAEQIRNNFISYTGILREGRYKTEDYLHAVTYVSYKLMGMNNQESWIKTFPGRYQRLLANGTATKDIAAHVSAYHRGKLVNLIMEQSLVPTWVLNQDLHQKALNVQADLMINASSEKVRTDAANSILTHLKKPDVKDFQINVDVAESSGMTELKNLLSNVAKQQMVAIEGGTTTKQIAEMKLIEVQDAEFVEVENEPDKKPKVSIFK